MAAKRVLPGLTVITIGLILLANTTGALPWSVWWSILMLWPLLLVAAGIDILGRSVGSTALRVLASLVVIGGLAYGALTGVNGVRVPVLFGARTGQAFSHAAAHDPTVTFGVARIDAGLSRLTLKAGDDLASANGRTPFGKPAFEVKGGTPRSSVVPTNPGDNGGVAADVSISSGNGNGVVAVPGPTDSFMDVTLDRSVLWETLTLNAGLSDTTLDMSGLKVGSLTADMGLSNSTITFGPETRDATIKGGLSSMTLRVPASMAVEVDASNGLGSIRFDNGWTRVSGGTFDGVWRTDGFDAASAKLTIHLEAGLSSVDVQRY